MTWRSESLPPVPEATAAAVKAAFPKGNLYVDLHTELGSIYDDNLFAAGIENPGSILCGSGKTPHHTTGAHASEKDVFFESIAIYPNPLNPNKYVVLNSSFTYREFAYLNNARQVPKLPDWAVFDISTPPNAESAGKVVTAGFFDENWHWKP